MNDEHPPIPVTGIKHGVSYTTIELHLTGGLRARRVEGGWNVGPIPNPNGAGWLGVVPTTMLGICTSEIGQEVLGLEERPDGNDVPARLWRPAGKATDTPFLAADRWGSIGSNAQRSGDADYARLAASIATSLRAAGLQLRNVSDCYYDQLLGAVIRKDNAGTRFANIALTELHIACHGLSAEMGSARDYLASVAAQRVCAPAKIDALNRLADWASKPANSAAAADQLVKPMIEAFDRTDADPWLWDLGEYRNTFLHRLPLGLSERANRLTLHERVTRHGAVQSIELEIEAPIGSGTFQDALRLFARLSAKLDRLAHHAASLAKYPDSPPIFVAQ